MDRDIMQAQAKKGFGRKRVGLEPVILLSLLGALIFFVISAATAYVNLRTLRHDSQKIVHSGQVLVTLGDLLASAQGAEIGRRGYLLTGNTDYLAPYNAALAAIPARLERLTRLVRDDPAQQAAIPALELHLKAELAQLKESVAVRRSQGAAAARALMGTGRGRFEMNAIRAEIAGMRQREDHLRDARLAGMNNAYDTAFASGVFSGLLGILLTMVVGLLLRRNALARQREDWLQSGQVGLAAAMLGDQSSAELGDSILGYLARHLGAVAGAIYIRAPDGYGLAAQYGVPAGTSLPERFAAGSGLLGQVARENRPLIVDDVPDGYITYGSALGQHKPRHLVIWPAHFHGTVGTVIELGFIRPLTADALTLLAKASDAIAVAIRSANYRAELQELLEDTQRKSEELQVQGEELRVSNEELEEQSQALKESQARLEQQQVELEQTNIQLEEQAHQLEIQRDNLAQVNAVVQLKARELERASQYKTDFLANMSHELRTPLNSSLILAKLLADNPDDNLTPEQVKYARTIQASGNDLLTLINDILDLSKIEAGHVDIMPEPVTLEQLASDMRRMFEPLAQSKGLAFAIHIAPSCPADICTDVQRLEQVLRNLLANAFKFTEKGKVELGIARRGEGRISLAVSDTGVGIPRDQQENIFEAFRQADGTISRNYGGTGLGLSVSRELARLLGGTIELESTPGEGSTFRVVIPETYQPGLVAARSPAAMAAPRDPAVLTAPHGPPALPAPHDRPMNGTPLRELPRVPRDDRNSLAAPSRVLLIIEDEEAFAEILLDLAREMGFQGIVAGTAVEALRLARDYLPSAIILDVGLPDQSGLSVLDQLKRDVKTRHIPIHMVSGNDHAQTALSLGAVGYLLKPVERDQLADVLKKLDTKLSSGMRRILIVEDDPAQREAVGKLLSSPDVETVMAGTAAACLACLKEQTFDCMVLDLSLPDASGYALLETLSQEEAYSFPPVIVYTGRALSADDEAKLRRYSRSIIIKGAKSPERLLDEVTLFLHRVVSELPDEQQSMIRRARNRDAILEGRRILVVEDDVRNVYALTNILEPRGAIVEIARNGREALEVLEKARSHEALSIDLVLMDVMMPVMDGLTATREIRKHKDWQKLPVITLTAKAMPDDQQRCIEAGASDYMAKPLDVDKLLSLVRVWMPR